MSVVAIIPARGGSKGIPRKNLAVVAGKPLIQHTIEQAKSASQIDKVYVSTDDEEIAKLSRACGARIIERPGEHASDIATSESALLHALEYIQKEERYLPDTVVFLQCTSPIRDSVDITNAIHEFRRVGADSLLSVVESHRFLWRLEAGKASPMNYNVNERPRRQDRMPEFMENGSLYIFSVNGFLISKVRLFGKIALYKMSPESAYEIDDYSDIAVVEALMRDANPSGVVK